MWSVRPELLAAIAIAGVLAPQRQPLAPGIETLIERIQERHEQTDLRARFVQNRLSRLGSVTASAEGELFISTPGRMRWEYQTNDQLLVAGGPGRETYLYFPKDNQVQVMRAEMSEASEYPILYLSGRGNLRRDFDIEVVEWGPPLMSGNVQLELRPRRAEASFERLIMEVDPLRGTIARLLNFDKLGNTVEYQFHELQFDTGLQDDLFEFAIPEGADVIFIGG